MTRSTNMEHVEVLREMRNRWAMPSEVAALDAAIAALSAPKSGDWVLVPREPSEAMGIAFGNAPGHSSAREELRLAWSAMLAAAPQPPAEPTNRAESSSKLVDGQPPAEAQAQGGGEVVAWMRRWAFDNVGVMAPPKKERPRGWNLLPVTPNKSLDDDVPLYAEPPSAPVGVEVPFGAIENGRIFADRLEAHPFESQGGDLRLCSDWQEFRRCFDYLAEWASALAQQPAAVDGVEQLTEQQAIIVTGYTGVLCGSFDAFHADLEKRAGRPVFTHEMAESDWIKSLYRDDFIALAQQGGEK